MQLTRLLKADGAVNVFAAALNKEGVLLAEMESLGLGEIPEFKLASFYVGAFERGRKSAGRVCFG